MLSKNKLLISSFLFFSIFSVKANSMELANYDDAFTAFTSYCMGEDAYNAASSLAADGWISENNSDLIEDEEHRRVLNFYGKNFNYTEEGTDIYTKTFNHGSIFLAIDLNNSTCSLLPLYDISFEEVLNQFSQNNVNPLEIYTRREDLSQGKFYLMDDQVINVIKINTENGEKTNILASSLNEKFSRIMEDKQKEIEQQSIN